MNQKQCTKPIRTYSIFMLLLACALGSLAATTVVAEEAAMISGYTISSEDPPKLPYDAAELAGVAGAADIGLSMALYHLGIDPGSSEYNDITGAVDKFFDSSRPQDREIKRESYVITYLPCMMWMATPTHSTAIRLPPGESQANMEIVDRNTREAFAIELNRESTATSAATGSDWSSGINMTPRSGRESLLGFDTREYSFESGGGLGNQGRAATSPQDIGSSASGSGLGAMVSVNNSGTAWVAEDVPGMDIVMDFYETFSREISAEQGDSSFFGGMIKNLVGMFQHGMPLHIVQSTQSKVLGKTQMSGTSESWVTSVGVYSRDIEQCSATTIPEGYEVTQMGSVAGSPPCDCSCEAFARLQQMGKKSKGKGKSDPADTAMAMCMSQCMSEFMACAMKGGR